MLLRNIVLFVDIALERGKDVALMKEIFSASALKVQQGIARNAVCVRRCLAIFRWNRKILQLFTKNDDRLFRE